MAGLQADRRPSRIKIPLLFDLVIVSEPDQIRQIEASGDVDRLHAVGTRSLPWWVPIYFRSTKFFDEERDLWFCPLEPASDPSYLPRRRYLQGKVDAGYSQEDVKRIADLLRIGADDQGLGYHMVQILNRRFLDDDVPLHVTTAAQDTVQSLGEAVLPWNYVRGRRAQQQIMGFCAHAAEADAHLVDVGHNIGEVMQATVPALRRLQANLDSPVEAIFTEHAPTPQLLRIAIADSTLDGLLSSPCQAGKTVVIYKIGEAAAATGDIHFTFGAGTDHRLCVFTDFFLNFMADLQQELLSDRAAAG